MKNKKAQTLVEYALIAMVVAMISIAIVVNLGSGLLPSSQAVGETINDDSGSKGDDWCTSFGGKFSDGTCTPP